MNVWIEAIHQFDEHPQAIDFHSHTEFEIYRFFGGDCRYLIHNRLYHLQPGDIIIMNGRTLHRPNLSLSVPYERRVVHFVAEWIRPLLDELDVPEWLDPFHKLGNRLFRLGGHPLLNKIDEHMQQLVDFTLKGCAHRMEMARARMTLAQLLSVIWTISETDLAPHGIDKHESGQSEKEEHVDRVIQWLNEHYTDKLTLDMIAENLNISKYYLARIFKEVTGTTIMAYMMNCRLNQAKYLLEAHPRLSILDVCYQSGFQNPAHFSRFFREQIGVPPSHYRSAREKQYK